MESLSPRPAGWPYLVNGINYVIAESTLQATLSLQFRRIRFPVPFLS